MVSGTRGKSLTVRFSSDRVDVMEIAVEPRNDRHEVECKRKKGYIFGEPCPEPHGEDMTGDEEWLHYYSALIVRMRCAVPQLDRVNQQQARWRARSLIKKLDDSDNEAHLGLVGRKRINNAGANLLSASLPDDCQKHTSSFPRQTSASSATSSIPRQTSGSSGTSLSGKASLACRRWWRSLRAVGRASPTAKLFCQCPADEIHFQDNALNTPERVSSEQSAEDSFTTDETSDRSPMSARLPRMLQWSKTAKVHVSFDSIMS
eukprot:TRINITY_DN5554_c0_g3_i1.p1 TRINITY_DN5554_c0_g3~~TRINITY_DN5554_c0_g3_i1.p1  ORF type:complete len:261 (+),score=22.15 TRINITY_DN5554_c0_g3_i1:76-858(+)